MDCIGTQWRNRFRRRSFCETCFEVAYPKTTLEFLQNARIVAINTGLGNAVSRVFLFVLQTDGYF